MLGRALFFALAVQLLVNVEALGARGHLDSVQIESNLYVARGWACIIGDVNSIAVHIYVGGGVGSGRFVKNGVADRANEAAVNTACGGAGGKHRFEIAFPPGDIRKNEPIFVYAIHPGENNPNPVLSNGNGEIKIP